LVLRLRGGGKKKKKVSRREEQKSGAAKSAESESESVWFGKLTLRCLSVLFANILSEKKLHQAQG
jgi:hypothetical protein